MRIDMEWCVRMRMCVDVCINTWKTTFLVVWRCFLFASSFIGEIHVVQRESTVAVIHLTLMANSYVLLLLVQVLILSEHLVHVASTIDRIRTTRERRQKIVNRRRRVSAASHSSSTSRFVADDESDTKATSNDDQYQGQQMEVLKENSVLHNDLIQVRNAAASALGLFRSSVFVRCDE